LTAQRLDAIGAAGGAGAAGAITFTLVFAVAVLPLSSTTLQVTATVVLLAPGESCGVVSVAVEVVPVMLPGDAL
jgi:hypothetical protein